MSQDTAINKDSIHKWVTNNFSVQKIEEELTTNGYDKEHIETHIKAFKKAIHAKRQRIGFACLAISSLLGFISCVLTIINPIPILYGVILYGLTSIAIVIIFIGLYYMFE